MKSSTKDNILICQALGLDPNQVVSIQIEIHGKNTLPTVTAVMVLDDLHTDRLCQELNTFNLVKKEGIPTIDSPAG